MKDLVSLPVSTGRAVLVVAQPPISSFSATQSW